MTELIGLAASYVFIGLAIGVATMLLKKNLLTAAGARKLIHVSVGHWWFIAMATMQRPAVAVIGPITFIVLNWLNVRTNTVKAMGDEPANAGTVYFPIALLVLVLATWVGPIPQWVGAIGVMVLSWGDAAAAVVGERWAAGRSAQSRRPARWGWSGDKSLVGSAAMLVVSLVVVTLILAVATPDVAPTVIVGRALAVAAAATLVEAFTPCGLDNLSVPLVATLGYWLVFG